MAKISSYGNKTVPVLADKLLGSDSESLSATQNFELEKIKELVNKFVDLDTTLTMPWEAGRISWDEEHKTVSVDTGIDGVRVSIGQEIYNLVFNNTGETLLNGTPVSVTLGFVGEIPFIEKATNDNELSVAGFAGVLTSTLLNGEYGFATAKGLVHNINTSLLAQSFLYLGVDGAYVQTRPKYPNYRLLVGSVAVVDATDGVININPTLYSRTDISGAYSFSSTGVLAGTYWKSGFYDWNSADVSLSLASPSVNYGIAGKAYAAHASIVASGAGIVTGAGTVGLRVTGIQDSELGIQVAGQIGIITTDITTLLQDNYYETSEKFSGNITFELYVSSGAPTAYSIDINYGYSKYGDFQNRDFTVTAFEAVWKGSANDSNFDIALKHHKQTGWTYAPTEFVAGNGDICRKSTDQGLAGNVVNGEDGAYKRVGLDYHINGSSSEGILIEVTTGANGTIQTMDMQVAGVSEELLN